MCSTTPACGQRGLRACGWGGSEAQAEGREGAACRPRSVSDVVATNSLSQTNQILSCSPETKLGLIALVMAAGGRGRWRADREREGSKMAAWREGNGGSGGGTRQKRRLRVDRPRLPQAGAVWEQRGWPHIFQWQEKPMGWEGR